MPGRSPGRRQQARGAAPDPGNKPGAQPRTPPGGVAPWTPTRGGAPGPLNIVTVEIRIPAFCLSALPLGGGGQCAGGVRPGNRARGLCQCESGSGASLGALPGECGSTAMFFEAATSDRYVRLREER
jgi:hypothetical protein